MTGPIKGTRGAEALEFALVLPAFLMFLLGVVDCGRLFWANATLAHAVEAAARCAAVNATLCGSTTAIKPFAVSEAWGLATTSSAFTVTTAACGTQITGTISFAFIIPWYYVASPFGVSNAMNLSAVACYPI